MRAQRIVPPETAFRMSRKKRPREMDNSHLENIRQLPCCVCGTRHQIEAAHIRMASRVHGKDSTGAGEKPSDQWVVPLCVVHHRTGAKSQHSMGEDAFWRGHHIDPFTLALSLYGARGNIDVMETILEETRMRRASR